jgi:hypothetical protein
VLPLPLSPEELLLAHMADVDAKLLRWEQYKRSDSETMGTINLVEFWKASTECYLYPCTFYSHHATGMHDVHARTEQDLYGARVAHIVGEDSRDKCDS